MSESIRILLADDHAILRQGTVALLRREPGLVIVGEADTGLEAVKLAHQLKPDLVIMDVRMPELSGVEATRRIRTERPEVKVIVLTAHDDDQYIFSALGAGASGYLLKTLPVSELIKAIRHVYQGQASLDPVITAKVMRRMVKSASGKPQQETDESVVDPLTARELEVLQSLADGLSNRAIADRLCISERTVQAHLTHIYSKLQVTSRTEAVLAGIRHGWLMLEV
jgi:DNA-binding NarL/FixJ family response regulator